MGIILKSRKRYPDIRADVYAVSVDPYTKKNPLSVFRGYEIVKIGNQI